MSEHVRSEEEVLSTEGLPDTAEGPDGIMARLVSLSPAPKPESSLLTMSLRYPRIILPEFNTHRAFSRSAASNRAVPASVVRERIEKFPFVPSRWPKNTPGMDALEFITDEEEIKQLREAWLTGLAVSLKIHERLETLGSHKQTANRVLEPYQYVDAVVTFSAGALQAFLDLRMTPHAQPEMQSLAITMRAAAHLRCAAPDTFKSLHIPFGLTPEEMARSRAVLEDHCGIEPSQVHRPMFSKGGVEITWMQFIALMRSAGRCARATFAAQDIDRTVGQDVNTAVNIALHNHMSPFEHQAIPCSYGASMASWTKSNLPPQWLQFRKVIETGELMPATVMLKEKFVPNYGD